MRTKFGVEAVIFREVSGKKEFLILHRVLNWRGWEFAKGGVEKGEKPEIAILREITEETGLKKIKIVKKLPNKKTWVAGDMEYQYDVFIVSVDANEKVKLQTSPVIEHDDFKWCSADEAMRLLHYENSKKTFREALGEI